MNDNSGGSQSAQLHQPDEPGSAVCSLRDEGVNQIVASDVRRGDVSAHGRTDTVHDIYLDQSGVRLERRRGGGVSGCPSLGACMAVAEWSVYVCVCSHLKGM